MFRLLRHYTFYLLIVVALVQNDAAAQQASTGSAIKLARVKYNGGGDWYNDPSAEVNLLKYVRQNTNIAVSAVYEYVDLSSDNIFAYPLLFMTGHGNMNLTDGEVRRLRAYLENGGFLYIDDDYGMNESVRREMKKVFPDQQFQELPFNHPLYSAHFKFPNGLPKIHEHDNKPPQGFGLFTKGRLCVYYTFETNPSDGWADPDVHGDPPDRRELALKIGTNIIVYALGRIQ
ncbi:MAG: DUF4159 domain-containing protein [Candidatus Kapabacteria bacterium]|nr:DUF4159 domain-containing protein [Candidatus Kapabacteria bacterium]